MTITVITQWEVSVNDHRELVSLARQEKTILERHGGADYTLHVIHTGSHAEQYVSMITYPDWEAFGHCMSTLPHDVQYKNILAAMVDFAELTNRVIFSGVPL